MTDAELLARYVRDRSDEAFEALVDRHAAMVRGVCLRSLGGDAARADEATQAVFVILAEKARTVRSGAALAGWLFRTARRTVQTIQRGERRRRARERAAAERLEKERSMRAQDEERYRKEWEAVRPHLDGALAALRPAQREAVLLSCLEGRPHAETAALLGCSRDAVRKRVQGGLRNLRRHLARKGFRIVTATLLGGMAAEAAMAAPPALLAACHAAAGGLAGGAVLGGAGAAVAKATMKAVLWWNVQTTAMVTTAVVAAGAVTAPVAMELAKPAKAPVPAETLSAPDWTPAPLRPRIPVGGGEPFPPYQLNHDDHPFWRVYREYPGQLRRLLEEYRDETAPWAETADAVMATLEDPDVFVASELAKRLAAEGCTDPLLWLAVHDCFGGRTRSDIQRDSLRRAVELFPGSPYPALFRYVAASRLLELLRPRLADTFIPFETTREEMALRRRARSMAQESLAEVLFDGSMDGRAWFEYLPPDSVFDRMFRWGIGPEKLDDALPALREAVRRIRGGAVLPDEIREAVLAEYHLTVAGQQRLPGTFGAGLWASLPPRSPDAPPGLPAEFDIATNLARAKAHAEAAWRAAPDWDLPPMLGLLAVVMEDAPCAGRLREGRMWFDRTIATGGVEPNDQHNPLDLFDRLLRQSEVEDRLAFALECIESGPEFSGFGRVRIGWIVNGTQTHLTPRFIMAHGDLAGALEQYYRDRWAAQAARGRNVNSETQRLAAVLYQSGRYAELLDLCGKDTTIHGEHARNGYSRIPFGSDLHSVVRSRPLLLAECRLFLGPWGERLRVLDALEAAGEIAKARAGWRRIAETGEDPVLHQVAKVRVAMLADMVGPEDLEPLDLAERVVDRVFSRLLLDGEADVARRLLAAFPDWVPGSERLGFEQDRTDTPPPFLAALLAGETDLVKALLDRGADPDAEWSPGNGTLLMVLAREGETERVRLLLEAGADPNAVNDMGDCPLGLAWLNGHEEVAALLEAAGATIPLEHVERTLTVLLAKGSDGLPYAGRLLEMGFSPAEPLPDGGNPIRCAIHQLSPRYSDEEDRVVPGLRWLIAHGADPDRPGAESGIAPIHRALLRSNLFAVRTLLEYDIDLNRRAAVYEPLRYDGPRHDRGLYRGFSIFHVPLPVADGWTPLALLVVQQNPDPDLLRRMLEKGADPTRLPEGYNSLAQLHRDWQSWLLQNNVDLEPLDNFRKVGDLLNALERGAEIPPQP